MVVVPWNGRSLDRQAKLTKRRQKKETARTAYYCDEFATPDDHPPLALFLKAINRLLQAWCQFICTLHRKYGGLLGDSI